MDEQNIYNMNKNQLLEQIEKYEKEIRKKLLVGISIIILPSIVLLIPTAFATMYMIESVFVIVPIAIYDMGIISASMALHDKVVKIKDKIHMCKKQIEDIITINYEKKRHKIENQNGNILKKDKIENKNQLYNLLVSYRDELLKYNIDEHKDLSTIISIINILNINNTLFKNNEN